MADPYSDISELNTDKQNRDPSSIFLEKARRLSARCGKSLRASPHWGTVRASEKWRVI
jgi:hypothetical protein